MAVITLVVGTRPNYMKMWPIWHELTASKTKHVVRVVSTGQHSKAMRTHVPLPHDAEYDARGTGEERLQTMIDVLKADFRESNTDVVVVAGDVDSTLAGAIAAKDWDVRARLIHYEAGLRSGDMSMPEERNRVIVDTMSDVLLCTSDYAMANCAGLKGASVKVGNTMLDTLQTILPATGESTIVSDLGLLPGRYALMTMHRPSLLDDNTKLKAFYDMLKWFAKRHPVVWPVHPRVPWCPEGYKGLMAIPPVTYTDFLALQTQCGVVITDSGGVQEEASFLGVPCVLHRTTTERPECLRSNGGSVTVAGDKPEVTFNVADSRFGADMPQQWDDKYDGQYADGKAGHRAAKYIFAIARGETP